jgi:hypothetical protein
MTTHDLEFWQGAILLISVLLSIESLLRLPLLKLTQHLNNLLHRVFKTLRSSRISDHWKERVMLVYAAQLLRYSLLVPVLLLIALFPLGFGLWVATESINALIRLSLDWRFLLVITVLSLLYLFVRKRFHA